MVNSTAFIPTLRYVTAPAPAGSGPHSPNRYRTYTQAADYFSCGPRAVERWVREGFVAGYLDASKTVHVDLSEVEAAFVAGKMRDPRKRFGSKARIVALPIQVDAVTKSGDAQ